MKDYTIITKNYSFKRIVRKLIMFLASKFPFLKGEWRARLFSISGVNFINSKTNFIGYNVYFDDLHPELITVGENTIITEGCRILSHFLNVNFDDFDHQYIGCVEIGDNVFIGMNSIITKPVKISNGAIIAAGTIIVKDVESYTIVGGNPGKFIKNREILYE